MHGAEQYRDQRRSARTLEQDVAAYVKREVAALLERTSDQRLAMWEGFPGEMLSDGAALLDAAVSHELQARAKLRNGKRIVDEFIERRNREALSRPNPLATLDALSRLG